MGQNVGGAAGPLSVGGRELGPHITQCRLGRSLPPYPVDAQVACNVDRLNVVNGSGYVFSRKIGLF